MEADESKSDDDGSKRVVEVVPRRPDRRVLVWFLVGVVSMSLGLVVPAMVEWDFRSDLVIDVDSVPKSCLNFETLFSDRRCRRSKLIILVETKKF